MRQTAIDKWHDCINKKFVDPDALDNSIAFFSPFVFKPILGIEEVTKYLNAANIVIANDQFKYTKELVGEGTAFLSFETIIKQFFGIIPGGPKPQGKYGLLGDKISEMIKKD